MVTILVDEDKNYVDLKSAVDAEHTEELQDLLQDLFKDEVVQVDTSGDIRPPNKRLGKMKAHPRNWKPRETIVLCNYHRDEREVAALLGRSPMAIKNRRPGEMADFKTHLDREGIPLPDDPEKLRELVKTYIKEQKMYEDKIEKLDDEIEELKESIEELESAKEKIKAKLDRGPSGDMRKGLTNRLAQTEDDLKATKEKFRARRKEKQDLEDKLI